MVVSVNVHHKMPLVQNIIIINRHNGVKFKKKPQHVGFRSKYFSYSDVKMSAMASQIIGVSIVFSTVCWCTNQRKYQSSASLAFARGIHRWPVDSPHRGPVTRKMFPFDDIIISLLQLIDAAHSLDPINILDKPRRLDLTCFCRGLGICEFKCHIWASVT